MIKDYFKRVTSLATKGQLIFWWILRLCMIFGVVYTLIMYATGNETAKLLWACPQMKTTVENGVAVTTLSTYNAVQMLANMVGLFAFEICQMFPKNTYPRLMPAYFQNITAVGFFLASFGGAFFNFYYVIPFYDKILHCYGCAEAVFISYELVTAMQKRDKKLCPGNIAALAAFGMAFVFAAGWELFEFTTDQWFGFDAQHWNYINSLAEMNKTSISEIPLLFNLNAFTENEQIMRFAVMDTMGDAVLNVLGAVPMYIFLRIKPYNHMGKKNVNKMIEAELANTTKETANA